MHNIINKVKKIDIPEYVRNLVLSLSKSRNYKAFIFIEDIFKKDGTFYNEEIVCTNRETPTIKEFINLISVLPYKGLERYNVTVN